MANPQLTSEQKQKRLQLYLDRMPSLSTTVSKVMEVCDRPDTSPNDLNRIISLDPVLTGRVLKLINSAYYSLPNQITTLARAIIMLGINTVKNLALSTAILGNVGNTESFKYLPMDQFWTHSLCVGVTAKALAVRKGISPLLREEFFVAGLLHDLGKIPLSNCFSEDYGAVFEKILAECATLFPAERDALAYDHGVVGRMIADKWELSRRIADTLCLHHELERVSQENQELVTLVALANIYANVYDIGSAGDRFPDGEMIFEVLGRAGLDWSDLHDLAETVESELEKARIFLQISTEG